MTQMAQKGLFRYFLEQASKCPISYFLKIDSINDCKICFSDGVE